MPPVQPILPFMGGLWRFALPVLVALSPCGGTAHATELAVPIHYLELQTEAPPTLSNLDTDPEDLGVAGAELGLRDNATTGRFFGHEFSLETTTVPPGGDIVAAARAALAGSRLIVVDAPAQALLAVADMPEAKGALVFNASAPDRMLRDVECRANLLHTAASLAMRTDALAQFLVKRRWQDLALITGTHPADIAFGESLKRSLSKFGLELGGEKTWRFGADMRRSAAQEVPLFTQDLGDYDVLLIADEIHDFGRYLAFNTWLPRPVAGSEGLVASAWAPVVEQWGAAQLQSRFEKATGRGMRARDYTAWAAVRAIGESVTRTKSADPATLRAFLLGPDFELAGFKGRPLSFRNWNGQLRQPIPLTTERALVTQAPLEGFLHRRNELDTLGLDKPESRCTAFEGD